MFFSNPSAKSALKVIFDGFTPEEMKILESPDCAIPYMYTTLLKSFRPWHRSRYSLEVIRDIADVCIYPWRDKLSDPETQQQIFSVCSERIFDK